MSNASKTDNETKKLSSDQGRTADNSDASRYRRRRFTIQNSILIWLDPNIDNSSDHCRHALTQLQQIVNIVYTFTDTDECIKCLAETKDEKVFMIVSTVLGQQIVPDIHDRNELHCVYVFSSDAPKDAIWVEKWVKVKGIYTDIETICKSIKESTEQYDHDLVPMSIISTSDYSERDLNELPPLFMYTQILKEILLDIEHSDNAKEKLVQLWREQYRGNESQLQIIEDFKQSYGRYSSIWWYTREFFLYLTLNKALRTVNIDILINMGFFLHDLHREIEKLHVQQSITPDSLIVYRGQGMLVSEFQRLLNSVGGLLSFNSFLSTSSDKNVSLMFCPTSSRDPNIVPVLFAMNVDCAVKSIPFAKINHISRFAQEEEVLFSMHTIFRIGEIERIGDQYWQVKLNLTTEDDQQLKQLTKYLRRETSGTTGWYRLGQLLIKMGNFDKAEEVYRTLLDNIVSDDESERSHLHDLLGLIRVDQGRFHEALQLYETGLELYGEPIFSERNHLSFKYSNIGLVYYNMGEYSRALEFYQQSLDIQQRSHFLNHSDIATTYNNIGLIYNNMKNYSKASEFFQLASCEYEVVIEQWNHEHFSAYRNNSTLRATVNNAVSADVNNQEYSKALQCYEYSLQLQFKSSYTYDNKPQRAIIYSNFGAVKMNIGNYRSALNYYEKALAILQDFFPSNHPDFALTYNNMGLALKSAGDNLKAFDCYEKALKIQCKSLPENHPDIATTYSNIASIYADMGKRSTAYEIDQNNFDIVQESFSTKDLDLAVTYSTLASVQNSMGKFSKALEFYHKTLSIQQVCLSENDPNFVNARSNINSILEYMKKWAKMDEFYQKSVAKRYQSFTMQHFRIVTDDTNVISVEKNMSDYPKALEFYGKTLAIQQQSLPENHPDVATTYSDIASMHAKMEDYSKALEFYEKALLIQQKVLPANHLDLATIYSNMGTMYAKKKENSKALDFYEKTLAIQQQSLPENHPDVATTYSDIASTHGKMEDYSKALEFYEKALLIQQKVLPANHLDLATIYSNLGTMYAKKKENWKALEFYQKTLSIQEACLIINDPDLASTYNNIASVYMNIGRFPKELELYEATLTNLSDIYRIIGSIHKNMSQCWFALQFYQKLLEIQEESLLTSRLDLATTYGNIGSVFEYIGKWSTLLHLYQKSLSIKNDTCSNLT